MDSRTTIAPFLRCCPTISAADSVSSFSKGFCEAKKFYISQIRLFKFDFVTGVGTQIKTKSACFVRAGSEVNSMFSSLLLSSLNLFTFSSSMSKAITFRCFEKASANGKPTYPKPTIQTVLFFILYYLSFSLALV